MKILAIAPQPFFSWRGTPFSVYYRTLASCELGHSVDVLTYGQGLAVEIPGARTIRIPDFRMFGAIRTGPSLLKLFLDSFMVLWTIGILLRRRYDVVHAHEEAVFWCRWLKPLFGFRLIYDMHSSLPQQLENFQFTSLRVLHWTFEKLEASAVRRADAVITICPSLRDYALTLTPDRDKVLLIENSLFDPVRLAGAGGVGDESQRSIAAETDGALCAWLAERPAERVIAYAGTLEPYQGIDRLIEAFLPVVQELPDAGLLIVGGQPAQVDACRRYAASLGLSSSVFLTGQLAQQDAQRLVARAGACVSPRFSGDNTPLKIYQLMASGVPLVATRIDSHTQVLDDEIAILTGVTTGELAAGMLQALRCPELARERALAAQSRYAQDYSRNVYTARMRALFARVA
jgi:glycosyltransferase involved in cell wall biosynthesis